MENLFCEKSPGTNNTMEGRYSSIEKEEKRKYKTNDSAPTNFLATDAWLTQHCAFGFLRDVTYSIIYSLLLQILY